jgi:transcriptional regulator with XRE-family HTH domain
MTTTETPPPLSLSGGEFRAWRARLRLSQAAAGAELGRTQVQISKYETGAATIPREIVLACAALEFGPLSIVRRRSRVS